MLVEEVIFVKTYKGCPKSFNVSDLPKDLREDDEIVFFRDEEGLMLENESYDPYAELKVIRKREETEEEKKRRLSGIQELRDKSKMAKVKRYIDLTKELSGKQHDEISMGQLVNQDVIDFRYMLIDLSTESRQNGDDSIGFNELLRKLNIHFSMRGYELG